MLFSGKDQALAWFPVDFFFFFGLYFLLLFFSAAFWGFECFLRMLELQWIPWWELEPLEEQELSWCWAFRLAEAHPVLGGLRRVLLPQLEHPSGSQSRWDHGAGAGMGGSQTPARGMSQ